MSRASENEAKKKDLHERMAGLAQKYAQVSTPVSIWADRKRSYDAVQATRVCDALLSALNAEYDKTIVDMVCGLPRNQRVDLPVHDSVLDGLQNGTLDALVVAMVQGTTQGYELAYGLTGTETKAEGEDEGEDEAKQGENET